MEFCKAEMAVITLMIEKTPTVIPEIVNDDRSLLAPSELHAIWMISSVSTVGSQGLGLLLFLSSFSYLSSPSRLRPVVETPGASSDRLSSIGRSLVVGQR